MKLTELKTKRCFDKFNNEIFVGVFVDVQTDPITRKVYKREDGELYFKPYEKEEKVSAYFKTDLIKIQ
ncbi:MAG: hypothetical protein IT243_09925 [Bacteroidia bacterium]|nr:hypothetical protein [Bacteroidia bacterium]